MAGIIFFYSPGNEGCDHKYEKKRVKKRRINSSPLTRLTIVTSGFIPETHRRHHCTLADRFGFLSVHGAAALPEPRDIQGSDGTS